MTFLRVESWAEERPPAVPEAVLRLLDHRWLRNSVALVVSLALDAGLILALVSLGRVELPRAHQIQQSITTFDIASVSAQTQGATSQPVAVTTTAPPPPTKATPPPPHPEWLVTSLPPTPTPTLTAPVSPTPPAPTQVATAPAQGLSASGSGSGAGYDPYAFASYRRPDPAHLSPNQALQPLPEAVMHLTLALGLTSAGAGRQIGLRVYVDPMGRIIRAEVPSGAPAFLAERLASIAPGFQLCGADSTRPPNTSLMVTLTV